MQEAAERDDRHLMRKAERSVRRALRMFGHVVGSVAFDVVLLVLFAWAGTITYDVPLLYAVIVGSCLVLFPLLMRTSWAARQADPALTSLQLLTASTIEIGFALYAPPVSYYFYNILFVIFAFGAMRLRLRQMLISFTTVSVIGTLAHIQLGDRLAIPGSTSTEQWLVTLSHAATLLRCCVVGWYGNKLRRTLRTRNRELAAASERIRYLAMHDSLTGTLLRKPVWSLIENHPCPPGFSIAMLDIDHFKSINDRYGHTTGDDVLRRFAETVRGMIRPDDAIGRYGGEEFLLLLSGTAPGAALVAAERIRRSVAQRAWDDIAPDLKVTVSAGIAYALPDDTVESLIERADRALYAAKHLGRNRVLLYLDEQHFETPERDVLEDHTTR